MEQIFLEEKNAVGRDLVYAADPCFGIAYQKEMMEKVLRDHLAEPVFSQNSIRFQLPPNALEDSVRPAELNDLLKALSELLEATDDAFLDQDRWLWDPAYWTWDGQNHRLKGVYLPDRRFTTGFQGFLTRLAMQMVLKSLNEGWQEPEQILMVHRFYAAASGIDRHEIELAAYLQKEEERRTAIVSVPAVRPSQEPPLFQNRKKGSFFDRIRRIFTKQSDTLPLPFS